MRLSDPIPLNPFPLEYISSSAIADMISCPEQFRQKRIQRREEAMGGDRFIGLVDHATHEENFRQKIKSGKDIDLSSMEDIYRAKWTELIDDGGEPDWRDKQPEDMFVTGIEMMRLYHTSVSPSIQPIYVEERFELDVGAPAPLTGFLDVVTGDRIIDRKTSGKKVSKPKGKWRLQGWIYQLAVALPVDFHVITKQVTPQVVTDESLRVDLADRERTIGMIVKACAQIQHFYDTYGPDEPWPLHGLIGDWACDYCSFGPRYARSCPAWR